MMTTRNFDLFIRKYDAIRQMLLQLFVYGCYNREQGAAQQVISNSYYSGILKRINYFWPQKLVANRTHTGKKINQFPFDGYESTENYLAKSYEIKSFSPQDLNCYIFILQALADGNYKSINDIRTDIDTCVYSDAINEFSFSMLPSNLQSMADAGFLQTSSTTPVNYRLAEDIFANFDTESLNKLHELIMLYRDVLPLSSLGYRCQHFLEDYVCYMLGDDTPMSPPIGLTDVFCQTILNDELVYKITWAIEHKKCITFQLATKHEVFTNTTPIRIIYDRDYGRQYLYGINAADEFFIRRLDYITDLYILKKAAADVPVKLQEDILLHIWSASLRYSKGDIPLIRVQILFHWDRCEPKQASVLKERLLKERRMGQVLNIDNEAQWIYTVDVADPIEMIPWIRSFGKAASVTIDGRDDIVNRINASLAAMKQNYQDQCPTIPKEGDTYDNGRESPLEVPKISQPELFTEYRNAYYRATLQLYAKTILNGEKLTKAKIQQYLSLNIFSHMAESKLTDRIAKDYCHKGENIKALSLWTESGNKTLIPSFQSDDGVNIPLPAFLMMDVEKRWLATLLEQPMAQEILGRQLVDRFQKVLSTKPFDWKNILKERGCHTQAISYKSPALTKQAGKILNLIHQQQRLHMQLKNGNQCQGLPFQFSYSPYRKSYIILVRDDQSYIHRLDIQDIVSFEIVKPAINNTFTSIDYHSEILQLVIAPIYHHNNIERCFLSFSMNKKHGYFDEKTGLYYLSVYYQSFEVNDIIRRLLSLGETTYVKKPESLVQAIRSYL